jgi:hypothetical protein
MASVFISHVEEDEEIASELASCLEQEGFSTWYFERNGLPGTHYLEQTRQAILKSSAFLILISRNAIQSGQVHKEVVCAAESDKPFIPVLVGLTHEEFKASRSDWVQAMGDATSVSLSKGSCKSILPKLVKGLEALGVSRSTEVLPAEIPPPTHGRSKAFRWLQWLLMGILCCTVLAGTLAIAHYQKSSDIHNISEAKWHPDLETLDRLRHDLRTKPLRIDNYVLASHRELLIREAQIIFDTETGALYRQGFYLCIKIFIPSGQNIDDVTAQWKLFHRTSLEDHPNQVWHHSDIDGPLTKIELPAYSTPAILSHIIERLPRPQKIDETIAELRLEPQEVVPKVFLGMVRNEWEFTPEDRSNSELRLQATEVYTLPYRAEWLARLAPISRIPTTPVRQEWLWRELEIEESGELAASFLHRKLLTRLQPFSTNYGLDRERLDSRMKMSKYETAVELLQLYR